MDLLKTDMKKLYRSYLVPSLSAAVVTSVYSMEEKCSLELVLKDIDVKSVLTKSNLPVADYSVNPYTGCEHECKYCYASFMKRFSNHPEQWGEFVDVEH